MILFACAEAEGTETTGLWGNFEQLGLSGPVSGRTGEGVNGTFAISVLSPDSQP